eukprot:6457285-Amphidinium_carterae.1
MDQKTRLVQEAMVSRDSLREELVDVYLHVRRLPTEEFRRTPPQLPQLEETTKLLGLPGPAKTKPANLPSNSDSSLPSKKPRTGDRYPGQPGPSSNRCHYKTGPPTREARGRSRDRREEPMWYNMPNISVEQTPGKITISVPEAQLAA